MTEADKRQKNIKLYPIYKMFSWDLLFYYAIIFLFLTQEKELTASDILLAEAFYPLSKLILQIPCVMLSDWLQNRKSIIIANIAIAFSLLFLIMGNGLITLIVFNVILAFGFNIKDMCESSILYDSISDSTEKLDTFSKKDGRGTSYHFYLDAICSCLAGLLFVFNPYLPIILCIIFTCVSIFLSFKFEEINNIKTTKELLNFKNTAHLGSYITELKDIFTFILKSNRLKSLLFFSSIFAAFLSIMTTLRTSLLAEIDVPEAYFGIVMAGIQFISGIVSKKHLFVNKIFKNKTLSVLALGNTIFLIVVGLIVYCDFPSSFIAFTLILWLTFYATARGIYYPIIKRYLNSFSIPKVNTKIYASQTVFDSLTKIPFSLLASYILSITYTSNSFIILGLAFSIIFIVLFNYMKDKVGLKPEKYNKDDIYYLSPTIR